MSLLRNVYYILLLWTLMLCVRMWDTSAWHLWIQLALVNCSSEIVCFSTYKQ